MMSYVDQFIQNLNTTVPEVKQTLSQIRQIDCQFQKLQIQIIQDRQRFLQKLSLSKQKKSTLSTKNLQKQLNIIKKGEKKLLQFSRQKVQLAQKLYNFIHQPTEKLDKELFLRGQKYVKVDLDRKGKKNKRKIKGKQSKEQWENDPNQPKYCYCGKLSFGQMVMCENTYCDKEWFHRPCIQEKKLPQKWFCKNCKAKQAN